MDTQVKAVAGLSREQVVEVLVWMIKANNKVASAMVARQYAKELDMSFVEYLEFSKEVFTAAGMPDAVAHINFSINISLYLTASNYPEMAMVRATEAASQNWEDFVKVYGIEPVIVSAPSSETIDIGIPGFYFVKP